MFKVQTLNKISDVALDNLPKQIYDVSADVESPDAILMRSFNLHETKIPSSVKAIVRAGAGTNNIPVDNCTEQGIVVFNTPNANSNAVKELVIASLLLSSRKIVEGITWTKSLVGQDNIEPLVEKGKGEFVGPEILGKKIGVIGLGAIGVLVCNATEALGMKVLGYDPFISVDSAWGLSRSVTRATSLEALLSESDYISVHVPLNEKTKNMFNEKTFASIKKGARLLNFSRGGLVDAKALQKAIHEGVIDTYVTDFPTAELLEMDQVINIPHLGASTPESEENCALMAASELRDFLELGIIRNSVNFPNCDIQLEEGNIRITLIHKNIPNMVGNITSVLATYNINIEDMINKSKGNWAYTIIDVNDLKDIDLNAKLLAIDGVISVRII